MKHKKIMVSLMVVLFLGLLLFWDKPAAAEDGISINVSPDDVLFEVVNMKPGDWAPRTAVVQNSGEEAFIYSMQIQNEGEDKLFNELLLEISASEIELYNGKLADFENLEERNVEPEKEEELEITIRFPEYLGNEFQGLNSEFSIIFTAESQLDETAVQVDGFVGSDHSSSGPGSFDSEDRGGVLPQTATNIFLFLLLGAALLVNGLLIYTYNKQKKRA